MRAREEREGGIGRVRFLWLLAVAAAGIALILGNWSRAVRTEAAASPAPASPRHGAVSLQAPESHQVRDSAPPPAGVPPIVGRVVVSQWGRPLEAGHLLGSGLRGLGLDVEIAPGGKWEAPVGGEVEFHTAETQWARFGVIQGPGAHPGDAIELQAIPANPALVHVLSGSNGAELDGIEVAIASHWAHDGHAWPGASTRLILGRSVSSPLLIPRAETPHALWFRAPGRAWARLVASAESDEESSVWLEEGGTISVLFDPGPPPLGHTLRLYSDSATREGEQAVRQGSNLLESVAPGSYRLRLETGRAGNATPIASCPVEVVALETCTVVLESLPKQARTPVGQLAGTIQLLGNPARVGPMELVVSPITPTPGGERRLSLQDAPAGQATLSWGPLNLPEGSYEVQLWPFQCRAEADVVGGASSFVEVSLPPLAQVDIAFVDESGGPVDVTEVSWKWAPWNEDPCRSCPGTASASEGPEIRLEVPLGRLWVEGHTADGLVGKDYLEVLEDGTHAVVRITGCPALLVRIEDEDGRPVFAEPEWWTRLSVEAIDGAGKLETLEFEGAVDSPWFSSVRLVFSKAGTYRLKNEPTRALNAFDSGPVAVEGTPREVSFVVQGLR